MTLPDFPSWVHAAETLLKLPTQLSWGVLLPCFLGSFCVMGLSLFLTFCDKLNFMFGIIANVFAALWALTLFCIICKFCALGGEKIKHEQEQSKRRETLLAVLRSLLPEEVAVFRYVASRPVGVSWLPMDSPPVIALRIKGCLQEALNISSHRGMVFSNDAECIAYTIPDSVLALLKERRSELDFLWGDTPKCDDLDIYQ